MSPTVSLRPHPPHLAVPRSIICLARAEGDPATALDLAEKHCRTTPIVADDLRRKAAVTAGSTAGSHWADDMAPYGVPAEAFAAMLSANANFLGRLLALCRRVDFRVKAPKDLGSAGGAWVGEGVPKAVGRTTTDTLTVDAFKASTLMVATREAVRFGAVAEAALLTMVSQGAAGYVVGQMFDPAVSASSAHPESLTARAAVVTTAGTTAANIVTDLSALIAAIQSPGSALVWVMRPLSYFSICAKLAGVGFRVAPGFMLGIPVLLSASVPRQITLLDASVIAYASDDQLELDVSTRADVQMDGAPTQSGLTGTGSAMVSLYQNGLVAIAATLRINYQHIYDGAGSPTTAAGAAYVVVTY